MPYLGINIDMLGDYIPNIDLEVRTPLGNIPIKTGDLIGLEQGIGRHFIYELSPMFAQNAANLHQKDENGNYFHCNYCNKHVKCCRRKTTIIWQFFYSCLDCILC